MRVSLAYGKHGLQVDLPADRTTVIEPRFVPGLDDEQGSIAEALRSPIACSPLASLVTPQDTVVIVFPDQTRAMPNERVLPPILRELAHVPDGQITLLNATGLHRENTPAELEHMLGASIANRYRVINHRGFADDELTCLGPTPSGGEAWLNKTYLAASKRIITGFIEPHFFAGFSGGPKMVCPGVGGHRTIMHAHSAPFVGHPLATWGITHGNPIHDEIRFVAALAPPTLSVSVTLNKLHQVTGVFAGDMFASHDRGCAFVKETAMQPVGEPYDIVISTNSGYPLDLNLYQTVKGMSAAAQIVRPGGVIIMAAECSQGFPNGSQFQRQLASAPSMASALHSIEHTTTTVPDQWQVQVQAIVQRTARVYLHTDGLTDANVRQAHLIPTASIEETVDQLLREMGPATRIAVLPQGPQTIPYIHKQRVAVGAK